MTSKQRTKSTVWPEGRSSDEENDFIIDFMSKQEIVKLDKEEERFRHTWW